MMINKNIYKYLLNKNILNYKKIIYNPSFDFLFKEEINPELVGFERGYITQLNAIAVNTGIFTGRSPLDKYIVFDKKTKNKVWWTHSSKGISNNRPINKKTWNFLKKIVTTQLSNKNLFIVDAFCGANYKHRLKVRFITEVAWQAHFVKNMFIIPKKNDLKYFNPDFLVLNASKCINYDWRKYKLHSEIFIAFNFTEMIQLIGGTWYGGEIKKGLFSVMNYFLPLKGIASMHCAANVNSNNNVTLFFGLSGTGKTTLSTNSKSRLIGDDEHGWDKHGVFNFEGGCYAKVMNLSENSEPEIYKAIKRNALLENVTLSDNGKVNFCDNSKTENTRVSYSITHIKNIVKPISKSGHAKCIIFLTADVSGILPAVAKLSLNQAKYYFLSGFTTKLSDTERGISNPIPIFSACFGSAFLTLHPIVYANILLKKIKKFHTKVFLINTGWNGYGNRISLNDTRNIIEYITNIKNNFLVRKLPIFNFDIPLILPKIDNFILDPRNFYKNEKMWIIKANKLASLFIKNFKKFKNDNSYEALLKAGPQITQN